MDAAILHEIGLNKSEANVYLTLLESGPTTTGPLMSRAKVSASKIYGILERLIDKGLASFIIRAKTKYYQASPPESLIDYFNERQERLKRQEERITTLVRELKIRQNTAGEKQEARIFLGWKGVQNAYTLILDILPAGSDLIGFVSPTKEEERKEVKLFYLQYHRKRVAKRYNTKLIATKQSRRVFEHEPYASFKRFEVKYVDNCPSGLVIFGDCILMIAFEEKPVAVIIRSRQIAESYRALFYGMWKMSKG